MKDASFFIASHAPSNAQLDRWILICYKISINIVTFHFTSYFTTAPFQHLEGDCWKIQGGCSALPETLSIVYPISDLNYCSQEKNNELKTWFRVQKFTSADLSQIARECDYSLIIYMQTFDLLFLFYVSPLVKAPSVPAYNW